MLDPNFEYSLTFSSRNSFRMDSYEEYYNEMKPETGDKW